MTDGPTETSNSEASSIPSSSQEPPLDGPIFLSTSGSSAMPPEAPESPTEAESTVPVINPADAEAVADRQTDNSSSNQPTPEPLTAQMGRNEPFDSHSTSSGQVAHDKPLGREVLVKAREVIQNKKRKKLDSILTLFTKQTNGSTGSPQVTNDEVEKLLHVSDATATRYLSILEKDGKIKQSGRTGRSVSYSKI